MLAFSFRSDAPAHLLIFTCLQICRAVSRPSVVSRDSRSLPRRLSPTASDCFRLVNPAAPSNQHARAANLSPASLSHSIARANTPQRCAAPNHWVAYSHSAQRTRNRVLPPNSMTNVESRGLSISSFDFEPLPLPTYFALCDFANWFQLQLQYYKRYLNLDSVYNLQAFERVFRYSATSQIEYSTFETVRDTSPGVQMKYSKPERAGFVIEWPATVCGPERHSNGLRAH